MHGGQMFSAFPTSVAFHPGQGRSDAGNSSFLNPANPNQQHDRLPGVSGGQFLDGMPLSDLTVSHEGSLASHGAMSQGGSLQSDVSSASAMYRNMRSGGQIPMQHASQGPPGSLDSAQSARIAEHLSARRGSLGPSPMEDVIASGPHVNTGLQRNAGPQIYNPELLASPDYQAAAQRFPSGGQVMNDTSCGLGGAIPAASGKAIVTDPSPGDVHMQPVPHVVRSSTCTHMQKTSYYNLSPFSSRCFSNG